MFCIPKSAMDGLRNAFKKGEISLEKLFQMSDEDRHAILESYLKNDKFASHVNANFEKAMVSTQKNAFEKFVRNTFGEKQKDLRTAVMKKIDKLDKVLKGSEIDDFLNDLVDQRLGFKVTEEEMGHMIDLKNDFEEKKLEITSDLPEDAPQRIEYGWAKRMFDKYVGELKNRPIDASFGEIAKHKILSGEILNDINDTAISLLSSLDDSFFGRQGIKELFSPFSGGTGRWIVGFAKSLGDIGKQLFAKNKDSNLFSSQSDAILDAIHAKILGSDEVLSGKIGAAKNGYGLGVDTEEYFPNSLPERIPLLGRLFKASEVAFNGGALRLRFEIAKDLIKRAEGNGVDVLDKAEADSLGKLTGDLTGRGDIGKAAILNKYIKVALFSLRFLKSNYDFLRAPLKYGIEIAKGTEEGMFARKQAALRTIQVIGSIAAIMTIANTLKPGSAELDPRSSNFGKIKVNGKTYDISGGMASLVTVAARLVPTYHNGKLGLYSKNSSTGQTTDLLSGKYGAKTALDVFNAFFEGKSAPLVSALRDIYSGQDYNGNKPTPGSVAAGLVTPISIQTFEQLKDPASADGLIAFLLDNLGISVQTQKIYKKKK